MKSKINLEKIVYVLLLILMIGIPVIKFMSYILYFSKIIKDSFIVNQVYLLWLILPLLITTYIIGLVTKKYKFNYTDVIIYILIILGFISTIFAKDINISIFGFNKRNEGLLTLLNYYFIFLNIKNIDNSKYKENIINIFLILGIVQVIYSVLQVYTDLNFIKHFTKPYMAMGLCGNPNFLGSYMTMTLLISTSYYLMSGTKKYLLLSIIYFVGLVLASSTGPFIGVILAFVFLLFVFHKKIKIKNIVILITLLCCSYVFIDFSNNYIQTKILGNEIEQEYNITKDLTNNIKKAVTEKKITDEFGNRRIELWKNLLPVAEDNWLIGAGLDNLALVFPRDKGLIYDKAHNIYYQMLLTNGVFSLITYCTLCLIIFIKGFRFKSKYHIAIYMAFVAYSIQGFANISVIDVAPYFFIILGLLHTKETSII